MVGIVQDITDRKLIEIDIINKNQELASALEELKSAEENLLRLNNELEVKVEARTKELTISEDELRQTLEESIALNRKIAESENLLSSIIDQSPVSTWIADANGTMLRLNEACLRLFGANDPSQGIHKYNLFQDPHILQSPHLEDIKKVFSEGKQIRFETSYNLSKVDHIEVQQGKDIYIISSIFPVKNEKGEVINAVVQAEDITEQKAAEEALKRALEETSQKNEELSRKNDFLDNFVFMAAHDLKSPVINLRQLIFLINEATDPAQMKEYLHLLDSSVNRLDYTVNGLVEVIEVQSDHNIKIRKISLEQILDMIIEENQQKLKTCGGTVALDLACKEIVYIEAYILSILKNLVGNAIKYRSDDRKLHITITTQRAKAYVALTVTDNGMGMDLAKYGKNLFKPFTRFTNKSYGKGIGLHLIKSMVEKNGGYIEVKSEMNAGSTFIIYLKEYEYNG